jgi:choloylglycine hydrolase
MRKKLFQLTALILFLLLLSLNGYACTGVLIKTDDGNYIIGRTMEFAEDYVAHILIFVPRNYSYTGHTPSEKPGMIWQSKYAYVGFSPSTSMPIVDDGLNEAGLYCGGFFHVGYAGYESVTESDYSLTISCLDLVSWILSTCSSAAEVREQLPKIRVCAVKDPDMGYVPPMQYFVADKTGAAIIIEYLNGKPVISDNKANVITNSPSYSWHTENLRNYIALKPENSLPVTINGNEFADFSQGSGAIGLPGDFSSPSRFVRAAFLANTAYGGKNVDEGIGVIFHIMNHFDIPKGSVRGMMDGKSMDDTAQWTSAADLTNAKYFYHTYSDRSVRMIDLNKLDLNAKDVKAIKDVQKTGEINDVSGELK